MAVRKEGADGDGRHDGGDFDGGELTGDDRRHQDQVWAHRTVSIWERRRVHIRYIPRTVPIRIRVFLLPIIPPLHVVPFSSFPLSVLHHQPVPLVIVVHHPRIPISFPIATLCAQLGIQECWHQSYSVSTDAKARGNSAWSGQNTQDIDPSEGLRVHVYRRLLAWDLHNTKPQETARKPTGDVEASSLVVVGRRLPDSGLQTVTGTKTHIHGPSEAG
jgi:hypothetical protein